MDLRLLEYFLRVAELGGINKAASDLNLSQPALSRHIAALEHEMGHQLFIRTQGGVSLTEAGKLLGDRARPLLRQFALLREQVGEKAVGQLAIGIPQSWQRVFTSPFVATMVSEHPAVALRVLEGVSHVLREHMLAGLADLCILPFDKSTPSGYRQTVLVREPLVLVASAREELKSTEPVPINRLDGRNLVLPGRTNTLRSQIEHSLVRKGLAFRPVVETDSINLCLDLARQNIGCTVVPACTLFAQFPDEHICWAPIRGHYLTWSLYENEARTHSPAVREGQMVALDTVAKSLMRGLWLNAERVGNLGM